MSPSPTHIREREKKKKKDDTMTLDDFIIESCYTDEQEEYSPREAYAQVDTNNYVDDTIIANEVCIFMSCKDKVSKKTGKNYRSRNCITKLYIDNEEVKLTFFNEMFNNYDESKETLKVKTNHPVMALVQYLSQNYEHNTFTINLPKFKETLQKIDQIKVKIYEYNDKGYPKHSFKVLAHSEK